MWAEGGECFRFCTSFFVLKDKKNFMEIYMCAQFKIFENSIFVTFQYFSLDRLLYLKTNFYIL